MKKKTYYVYRLDFIDKSVYYGESGTPVGQRERDHKRKWKETFKFEIIKQDIEHKSDAIVLENYLIISAYLQDKTKIRNRFLNKTRLRD
jgi:hypothetical protein